MKVCEIIWLPNVVEKLKRKHQVRTQEVTEALKNKPKIFFQEKGHVKGEDLYEAMGRTEDGRYLAIFFIRKKNRALVISARDMTQKERRRYGRQ